MIVFLICLIISLLAIGRVRARQKQSKKDVPIPPKKIQLGHITVEDLAPVDLPPGVAIILQPGIAELSALGFFVTEGFRHACLPISENWLYALVLSGADGTRAVISPAVRPLFARFHTVYFHTAFEDGTSLRTFDCYQHEIIGTVPNELFEDYYLFSLSKQFLAHSQRVRELELLHGQTIPIPSPYSSGQQSFLDCWIAGLQSSGIFHPVGNNRLEISTDGYAQYSKAMTEGQRRATDVAYRATFGEENPLAGPLKTLPPVVPARSPRSELPMVPARSLRSDQLLLGATFFLLVAEILRPSTLGTDLAGLPLMFWILGVTPVAVIVHEIGHWIAARVLGAPNPRISYSWPLSGSVFAVFPNFRPGLWRTFLFVAMGPMPGLVLAIGLTIGLRNLEASVTPDRMFASMFSFLFVNFVAVLPIRFYDGAILLRLIFLRVRTSVLSGVGLFVLALGAFLWSVDQGVAAFLSMALAGLFFWGTQLTKVDLCYQTTKSLPQLPPNSPVLDGMVLYQSIQSLGKMNAPNFIERLGMFLVYAGMLASPFFCVLAAVSAGTP